VEGKIGRIAPGAADHDRPGPGRRPPLTRFAERYERRRSRRREQIDGDEVVVRITVTPERPADGPKLASDVLEAISNPTDGRLRPAR
jgi:hypothetical protein